jgi:long-chain acyl-CoA synthetase
MCVWIRQPVATAIWPVNGEALTMVTETTLAQLFRNRAATYGNAPRWRQRQGGGWQAMTWRENQAMVNELIAGLDALGAGPGDVIGILSNTRWEWMAADWAIIGLGGVSVTIYPSNVPATIAFILNDSDAHYVFVEDRSQYEKLVAIREQIPRVRRLILFEDAEELAGDPWVISFADLRRLSPRTPADADALAAARAEAIRPEDRLTLVYTSGTTGRPKGAVHTHATFMAQLHAVKATLDTIRPGQVDLLFLPLSHVFGREEHFSAYDRGMVTSIAPSLDHLVEELRDVRPDLFFSVPRVYEKAYAAIMARVEADSALKRRIFHWAVGVGRQVSRLRQDGKRIPAGLAVRYRLADRLVFHKIREVLGGNLKFAVTAGAPLDLAILEFFNAAGVLLLEGWGLTETSGGFTLNRVQRYRFGTVGTPYPDHELRIAEDGEILVRGPCVFVGYHNNPQATAEAIDAEGWFHTGDVGAMDADGFVRIVDRKKDLIITAGGKNIAPQLVEGELKKVPCVSQVIVYGDRKPYLVALLTLDPAAVQAWADERGIRYADVRDVYADPRLRAFLDEHVAAANTQLASFETVKYYDVLPEDFTVENGLLTPTLKIRRRTIYQRYAATFERLYQPTPSQVGLQAHG